MPKGVYEHKSWDYYGDSTKRKLKQKKRLTGNKYANGHKPWNKGLTKEDPKVKQSIEKGIETQKGKHWSPETEWKKGQKSTFKGKKHSTKAKNKLRQSAINQYINGKFNNRDTNIERIMENYLLFNNILYVKQFKYKLGVADFWLPETNTIIECDGDYWHDYPNGKSTDDKQTKWLENNDYIVYRFWGSDIKNNIKIIMEEVLKWIT